jgi:hypothetical protein
MANSDSVPSALDAVPRNYDLAIRLQCNRIGRIDEVSEECLGETLLAEAGIKFAVRQIAHHAKDLGRDLEIVERSNDYELAVRLQCRVCRPGIVAEGGFHFAAGPEAGIEAAGRSEGRVEGYQ